MSNRTISETTKILLKAKETINTPDKWIKGSYHRDGAYCAAGALYRAGGWDISSDINSDVCKVVDKAYDLLKKHSIKHPIDFHPIAFNDEVTTTHEDVMKMFDEAITESMKGN